MPIFKSRKRRGQEAGDYSRTGSTALQYNYGGADAELGTAARIAYRQFFDAFVGADVGGVMGPIAAAHIAAEVAITSNAVRWIGPGAVLYPVSYWQLIGNKFDQAFYRLHLPTPQGGYRVLNDVPSGQVLHVRKDCSPGNPWVGRSPWPYNQARLVAALEKNAHQRAGIPVGQMAQVPHANKGYAPERELKETEAADEDLLTGFGGTLVITRPPVQQGAPGPSTLDTGTVQDEYASDAVTDAVARLLAAVGITATLVMGGTSTGVREAERRFLAGPVHGLAQLLTAEVVAKVGQLAITFPALVRVDLTARTRALKQLKDAGVALDEARKIVGI